MARKCTQTPNLEEVKHVEKESKSKSRLGKGRTKVAGHKGNGQEKNIVNGEQG